MSNITVVSAPGKVLIAGGYLVLDPAYSGVVVSTSSRFFTVVRDGHSRGQNQIQVRSPQFLDATWHYEISFNGGIVVQPAASNTSTNKFVHLALQKSLSLLAEAKGAAAVRATLTPGLDIGIVGDNDFYSQRAQLDARGLPRTLAALAELPPFCPAGVRLSDVEKTGLGSSAALITSLVAALLLHSAVVPTLDDDDSRRLVHNAAQYIHCLAQGKVGSGFDVSAAVFGSQLYTRFEPTVIQSLMGEEAQLLLPVLSPKNAEWNNKALPFRLPPCTRIMLADVGAGSNTPSLVGKVLKWRKENSAQAHTLWTALDEANQSLAQTLLLLTELHISDPKSYLAAVKFISSLQPVQWTAYPDFTSAEEKVVTKFYEAHEISQSIREKMREMGELSGVPIEPPEQTQLLDACAAYAGVIAGGVPGAGGYDAVWLLVCDPPSCDPALPPVTRVEHLWGTWAGLAMAPLSAVESLGPGARTERLDAVVGLHAAIAQ